MKKIIDLKTLEKSNATKQEKIIVSHYLKELFELYNINTIEGIGGIFILEKESELSEFKEFGMYEPISADNIEFVDKIFLSYLNTQEPLFVLACFLISTDYAIYLLLPKNILSAEYQTIFEKARFKNEKYINLEE